MLKIQKRWIDDGVVNPTDQVLMAKHLLEATLMDVRVRLVDDCHDIIWSVVKGDWLMISELFVFELLTKLSIGSSSYNGILVFAAVSSIKPRKIRTESADNRSINLIAA
ncbi:hypothetical protein JRO89_XS09G0182700 [Xanthoceras sorbifolium]|uniref:Uncharacterized protein n=1 Tax=Xanthoceras sorbifolium TaxID=99658 RepID=A0ABQ8HLR3_9ROSI|nr:hypothetical protein JRO89_XS09G0182700 [Xanthoceras sorbifolium]